MELLTSSYRGLEFSLKRLLAICLAISASNEAAIGHGAAGALVFPRWCLNED